MARALSRSGFAALALVLGFALAGGGACGAPGSSAPDAAPPTLSEAGVRPPDEAGPAPSDAASPRDAAVVDATDAATCAPDLQRCAVPFDLAAGNEAAAEVRGDWAPGAWDRGVAMTRTGGAWHADVPLPPGKRVEYKYCLDPRSAGGCASWRADPTKPSTPPNGNNVLASVSCAAPTCPPPRPPGEVRFVALGDTGKANAGQDLVAAAMAQHCHARGCDFALLLGDNIYDSGASSPTDPQFKTKFEDRYAQLNFPFYVALGNHDYGGGGAGNDWDRAQNEVDYTAHSTKWKMPARRYRVPQGVDLELFALDTNAQMYGWDLQQSEDVAGWLAASTATWKIVFGHHPYLSNGPHGNAGTYDGASIDPVFSGRRVKAFAEQVWCGKADLYLSGHDHVREWMTETCQGTELCVSGAGATPTSLPGSNATRFQSAELGFLYVVVSGRTLTAELVHSSGTVQFTRTLTK